MVKIRWRGRIAGVVQPAGGRGSVVIPINISEVPGQIVEVPVPISRTAALIKQIANAAQRERAMVEMARRGWDFDRRSEPEEEGTQE